MRNDTSPYARTGWRRVVRSFAPLTTALLSALCSCTSESSPASTSDSGVTSSDSAIVCSALDALCTVSMPCPATYDETEPPPAEWCGAISLGVRGPSRSTRPCGGFYEVVVAYGKDTVRRYFYDQSTRRLVGVVSGPSGPKRCAGFVGSMPPVDDCAVLDQPLCSPADAGADSAID